MSVKKVLQPRWIGLHLFTIAICTGMVLMGRWQWSVGGEHRGDLRNYGYALQWWVFTIFGLVMWWRIIRDSDVIEGSPGAARPDGTEPSAEAHSPTAYVGYRAPTVDAASEDDPERRAYNDYLARLNEQQEETR